MKAKFFQSWTVGAMAAMICLAGGTGLVADAQDQPPPAGNAVPDDSSALPPNIDPSSPLAQIVKLTQAGVSEDVIMAYITNSGSPFDLDPDEIIYLKDIGVPDDLVTAMMQRDQGLQAQMAGAANPPPQPAPETDATVSDAAEIAPPPAEVTVGYFYDTLAPYGAWLDVEGYGRCWRPTVMVADAGWQPYCDHGHWVWTDDGWYWISDYSWGWAAFHYGRWFRDARFGWCWVPDTVWGPSWVTWRYSADYCGWAPLPPFTAYVSGIGLTYHGAAVSAGFDFGLGASVFTFVPTRDFCDPHPRRYRVGSGVATQIYSHTTVINNFGVDSRNRTFINHGIDPQRITEVTHAPIHPVAIRDASGPVARGEQLGRGGRTLIVNRPHFAAMPLPSNRGESPTAERPYQPAHYGNENNNSYVPRNEMTPPPSHSLPGNRYAPVSPVQPSAPIYNSTDNRRYPSPKMQQMERQSPPAIPGGTGGRLDAPAASQEPARPPQHGYSAPVEQPPPRNYVSPRNEAPPVEARPNYSHPPAAENPSRGATAPSPPPAQSQRSGGNKNRDGQQ